MGNNQLPQQGILKSNDRLARAKQFFVGALFGLFVAVVSLGASVGLLVGMKSNEKQMNNIVHEFVETREYQDEYSKTYIEIKDSDNYVEEVSKLRSYDYAAELLKNSKNEELKTEYIKKEQLAGQYEKNGVVTSIAALGSISVATVLYTISEKEKNKKKKEENEESERNMA